MRITLTIIYGAAALLYATAPSVSAGDLIYRPVNPSFGGNPFNNTHLQTLATTQRQYAAPQQEFDSVANFERTITNSILGRVANQISDSIFGENAQDSGNFSVGSTQIEFVRQGDTVNVDILDSATGGATSIALPVTGF